MRRISALLFTFVALVGTCATGPRPVRHRCAAEGGTTYTAETPSWTRSPKDPGTPRRATLRPGARTRAADLLPSFAFGGSETTLGGVSEPNVAVYPAATGHGALPERCRRHAGAARRLLQQPRRQPRDRLAGLAAGRHLAAVLAVLLPRRRAQRGRLADRLLRLPAQGRRRGDHGRALDRRRQDLDERGQSARAEPGLLPDGGHQRRRPGTPVRGADRRAARSSTRSTVLPATTKASACSSTTSNRRRPTRWRRWPRPNRWASTRTPTPNPKSKFPTSGGVSIPVSTLGSEGSPEHIVAGSYEDYNAASPSRSIDHLHRHEQRHRSR